jgi:hypothetical protein
MPYIPAMLMLAKSGIGTIHSKRQANVGYVIFASIVDVHGNSSKARNIYTFPNWSFLQPDPALYARDSWDSHRTEKT